MLSCRIPPRGVIGGTDADRLQPAPERSPGVAAGAHAPRRGGRGDRFRLHRAERSHRRAARHPRALSLFRDRRVSQRVARRAPRAARRHGVSGGQDFAHSFSHLRDGGAASAPVLTAKILSTIDVMSGGRIMVGVGAGWLEEEFEALGAPPFAERGKATDEYLQAFRELWTKDKPHFDGRFVKFTNIVFVPKPVQKPHPPLWVGGESGPAMRRAARLGNGWYPIGSNPRFPLNTL